MRSAGATCSCGEGIALPVPTEGASAGTLTVQAPDCGTVLATLLPDLDGGLFSENPFAISPDYSLQGTAHAWSLGDALHVSAAGDPSQVHAFAATLQTGAVLAGLTPAIGATPLGIAIGQDLVISWTPEGRANETVTLFVGEANLQVASMCECVAPNSAGQISLRSSDMLAARFVADSNAHDGVIGLTHDVVSLVGTDTANVELNGQVNVSGPATFR
jgi:hypothetical protein